MSEKLSTEDKEEIKNGLTALNTHYKEPYIQVKDDLTFASGNHYDDTELATRGDQRPNSVLDMTGKIVKRIVNPTRQTPYKAEIKPTDEDMAEKLAPITEQLQSILDDTVNSQESREAIDTAFSTCVPSGYGDMVMGLDFVDNDSLDQVATIERIIDPTAVKIDPFAEKIDGSDANYAAVVRYIDKVAAEKRHGKDTFINEDDWGDSIYAEWDWKENSIPEVFYYSKEPYKVTRIFAPDGDHHDLGQGQKMPKDVPEGVKTRTITKYKVKLRHLIGETLINTIEIPMENIPIYPVYGEVNYENDSITYSGIVKIVRPIQKGIDNYFNSEQEQVASAPISQWLLAYGQDEGNPDDWNNSNKRVKNLRYKVVRDPESGAIAPPPQRVDNTVQTASLIASRVQLQRDMGEAVGMPDVAFGMLEGANQSGKSVINIE